MVDQESFYAYLAGVIDGEGSIGLTCNNKRRNYYILQVSIGMTDFRIPKLFQKEFGGSFFIKDKQPYFRRNGENRRPLGFWGCTCQKAKKLIEKLLPYLIVKKEQAEEALKFMSEIKNNKHKKEKDLIKLNEFRLKFKKLNKRGQL